MNRLFFSGAPPVAGPLPRFPGRFPGRSPGDSPREAWNLGPVWRFGWPPGGLQWVVGTRRSRRQCTLSPLPSCSQLPSPLHINPTSPIPTSINSLLHLHLQLSPPTSSHHRRTVGVGVSHSLFPERPYHGSSACIARLRFRYNTPPVPASTFLARELVSRRQTPVDRLDLSYIERPQGGI